MNAKTSLSKEVSWQAIALAIARHSCRSGLGKLARKKGSKKVSFFPCKKRRAPYKKGAKYADKVAANMHDTHAGFVRSVLRMKKSKPHKNSAHHHPEAKKTHSKAHLALTKGDKAEAFSLLQVSEAPNAKHHALDGDRHEKKMHHLLKDMTAHQQWHHLTTNHKARPDTYNHDMQDLYLLQYLETGKIRGQKPRFSLKRKLKQAKRKIVGLLARALRKIAKSKGPGRKKLVKKLKKKAKGGARTLLPLLSCVKSAGKGQLKNLMGNLLKASPKVDKAAASTLRSVLIRTFTNKKGIDLARYAVNSLYRQGASYTQLTFKRSSMPREITSSDPKPHTRRQKLRDTLYHVLASNVTRAAFKTHMFLKMDPRIFALGGEPKITNKTRTVSGKVYMRTLARRGKKDRDLSKPRLDVCSAKRVKKSKKINKKTGKPKKGPLHFDGNKFAHRMHHSFIRGVDFSATERYCIQNTKPTRTVLRSILHTLNKEAQIRGRRMVLHIELGHGAKSFNKRKIFNAAGEFIPDRKAHFGMSAKRLMGMCAAIKVRPSANSGLPVNWSYRFSKRKNKFVRVAQNTITGRANLRAMLSALERIFKKYPAARRANMQKNVLIRFGRPSAVSWKSAHRMKQLKIQAVVSLSKKAKFALLLAKKPKYLYKKLRNGKVPSKRSARGTFLEDFMVTKAKRVNGTRIVKSMPYSGLLPHIRKIKSIIRLRASRVRVVFGSYGSGLSGGNVKNAVRVAERAIAVFEGAAAQCAKDSCTKKSLKEILKGKKHKKDPEAKARAAYAIFRPRFFRKFERALSRRKAQHDAVLKGLSGLAKSQARAISAMVDKTA